MRKLLLPLCLSFVCLPLCAAGTTIADTIRTPFGGLWNGSIKITCPSGVNAAGQTIEEFTQSITVINGAFRVTIDPGDAGSPKGRTCSATYSSPSSSAPSGQPKTWLVPTSATPLKIPQVQTGPVPAPPATLLLSQIAAGGATLNQAMCWLGLSWGPGHCGGGTWGSITGTLSAQSDLSTALSGKVSTSDSRLSDARTPTAHTHPESDVTNLSTDLAGKVGTTDSRLSDARTPTAHNQAASTITDFQTAVSANSDVAASKAAQHAQGTDQGLDTGGTNAVTAAQAKAGYTHSQATGNPHGTTTADVSESGNLYFTAVRAQTALANLYQTPITGAPSTWPTTFAPALHAGSHATGQADAIAPSTIGAMAALSGTGAVKVTSGAPGLVSGSAGDCVHVDGGSGACGGGGVDQAIDTSGPVTVATTSGYNWNNSSGALTYNLPTITAGMVMAGYSRCFGNLYGKSGALTLQAPASTYIALYGTLGSAAGTLVSSGALGDSACVVAVDTTHYQATGTAGNWTNN
jgi:hypothetical protein